MASTSPKQAKMFWRAHHDADYAASRGLKPEGVAKMHAEDLAAGEYFDARGLPRFDVSHEECPPKLRRVLFPSPPPPAA